ncbi:MAG TPA: hypothetical protein VGA37_01105 [Gemmatimonadales bacterium]
MRAWSVFWLSCIVACTASEDVPRRLVVRDSLGLRIVENHDDSMPRLRLSSAPLLDIGSERDTLTSLFHVEGAHRLSDGRIVIANRGTDQIRFYDAEGGFLDAVGRSGEGPGEYGYIAWTARCGTDTLYVYDIATRRLTVLNDHGETIRATRLMLPHNTAPYGVSRCQHGGPFVSAGWSSDMPSPGLHRNPMPVGLATLDGEPLAMIGTFPGVDRWGIVFEGQLRGSSPLPLGRDLLQTIVGDRVFIGTGNAYEIAAYRLDGTLEMLIRLDAAKRPVAAADLEAFIERQLDGIDDDDARARTRRYYRDMELPDRLPPYAAFLVDEAETLWIQDYPGPRDREAVWRRFSTDGAYIGVATMPADLKVFEIGDEYVLGMWKDDLDVEHVRLYALET